MKAVILGTTGYTGMILLRLLADHPDVDEIIPVSSSRFGQLAASVDPGIGKAIEKKLGLCKGNLVTLEEAVAMKPDVVFAGLPHLESAKICQPFFGKSVVIDLSADFRTNNLIFRRPLYRNDMTKPLCQETLSTVSPEGSTTFCALQYLPCGSSADGTGMPSMPSVARAMTYSSE